MNRPRPRDSYPLRRKARAILTLAMLLLLTRGLGAEEEAQEADGPDNLPERYQVWLQEVELLITPDETATFLELERDYQRDYFIERFWRIRDPYEESGRNELRERWERRVQLAHSRYEILEDARSHILLLHGEADGGFVVRCGSKRPMAEVWYYRQTERVDFEIVLIFVKSHPEGPARLWRPAGTSAASMGVKVQGCRNGRRLYSAVDYLQRQAAAEYSARLQRMLARPRPPNPEWVATFEAYSTQLPEQAEIFAARLALDYLGRYQSRTVTQGLITVPVAEVSLSELGPRRSYDFLLTGEVLADDDLFDNFRYKFTFPEAAVTGESIPLVFERYLRPGGYTLIVRLEDLGGGKFYRHETQLEVPKEEVRHRPEAEELESRTLLAEANAALATDESTVKIVLPDRPFLTGQVRIDTLVTGEEVDRVAFYMDGRLLMTKNRPPYSVELDLGHLPRMRRLRVTALDSERRELASDRAVLNAGGQFFAVRLLEPKPGKRYRRSLRAHAEVIVPDGRSVERVEYYLNEHQVATLYQPPWIQPVALPGDEELTYVRAVAYLPDGNFSEDLVVVNAPDYFEEIDIQFVELYSTVLDGRGRPVQGLGKEDFRVVEDGVEQEILRFDRVTSLPFHAAIVLDTSGSMREHIDQTREAALRFFDRSISPKDRAAVITFNDTPNLAVKFTSDLTSLAGGLAGLRAERGTALYDSLIFSLYYFNGVKGQRAILLLSDGKDEDSRFDWQDTLDYARRAGVTIYTVGLNLSGPISDARRRLTRLAEETGGQSFFIRDVEELGTIYASVEEELRSQYFLAYQSSNRDSNGHFRTIEVEVPGTGFEVKTLSGYYP